MSNTFYPSQIGFIPTGNGTDVQVSSVVLGRTITGTYEAIGFGSKGRPDYLEDVIINLTQRAGDGTLTQKGSIVMNVQDLISAATTRSQFPTNLNLTLKEVLVCENSVTKGMIILGSQTYPTGAA